MIDTPPVRKPLPGVTLAISIRILLLRGGFDLMGLLGIFLFGYSWYKKVPIVGKLGTLTTYSAKPVSYAVIVLVGICSGFLFLYMGILLPDAVFQAILR